MSLIDQFNRKIDYLRIGVTDRCNLRCRYCMPEEGIDFSKRKDLLTYEEIIRLGKIFRALGIQKVRLTGGEPFLRKGIELLLKELTTVFPQVHITTNATLIHKHFDLLKDIKIAGLNISIDSLDRNRFQMITKRDDFGIVFQNIMACKAKAIPFKINVVVMQGINDDEIIDFVDFGIKHQIEVRFIEAMPFNDFDGNKSLFLSADKILEIIKSKYVSAHLLKNKSSSSSLKYQINTQTKIGIIPAYSRSLCGSCNRIRLTPKGEMLNCLYAKNGLNLLAQLRDEKISDDNIKTNIIKAVFPKLANGFEEEKLRGEEVFNSMTTIGG